MPQVAKNTQTILVPCDIAAPTIETFEQDVCNAVAGKPDLLKLDCQALIRVVSTHINIIWNSHSLCRSHGIVLHLVNPTAALMRILRVLDLVGSFDYEGANHEMGQRLDRDIMLVDLPQSFTDTVHPVGDDIDDAIARFVAFLADARVSATTILELRTLYYEIATNIRLHSGITTQDQFRVNADAKWNQLTITFSDPGKPFDPTAVKTSVDYATASHNRQKRGYGLPMIQQLADLVAYHRDVAGHNLLTITKKWHR